MEFEKKEIQKMQHAIENLFSQEKQSKGIFRSLDKEKSYKAANFLLSIGETPESIGQSLSTIYSNGRKVVAMRGSRGRTSIRIESEYALAGHEYDSVVISIYSSEGDVIFTEGSAPGYKSIKLKEQEAVVTSMTTHNRQYYDEMLGSSIVTARQILGRG